MNAREEGLSPRRDGRVNAVDQLDLDLPLPLLAHFHDTDLYHPERNKLPFPDC